MAGISHMLHLVMKGTIKCGIRVQNKLIYANRTQNRGCLDRVGLGENGNCLERPLGSREFSRNVLYLKGVVVI